MTFTTPNDITAKDWIHLHELIFEDAFDPTLETHQQVTLIVLSIGYSHDYIGITGNILEYSP